MKPFSILLAIGSFSSIPVFAVTPVSTLPVSLTDQDVPTVAHAGSMSGNPTTGLTITEDTGGGSNTGYNVAYQTLTGDGEIQAQVVSIASTGNVWASAGVFMTAEIGGTNVPFANMHVTQDAGIGFSTTNPTSSQTIGYYPGHNPYYVKLVRQGDTISGYGSSDGLDYIFVGSETFSSLGSTLYVGVRVSGNDSLASDVFDNIQIAKGPIPPSYTDTLYGADTLVDSIGFNTQFSLTSTTNAAYNAKVQGLLGLGVRHIREGITTSVVSQGQFKDLNYLYGNYTNTGSIKIDMLSSPYSPPSGQLNYGQFPLTNYINGLGGTNHLEAFEGLNEYDNTANDNNAGTNWASDDRTFQQAMYNSVTTNYPGIAVIGPSLIGGYESATNVGLLTNYMDYACMHSYPGNANPGSGNDVPADEANLAPMNGAVGALPYYATETGYGATNAPPTNSGWISLTAQAKYENRLFLEYYRQGVARTYQYQLMDDPTIADGFGYYGILNYGGGTNGLPYNAKPAYTALQNLTSLLAEPGVTLEPSSFPIRIEGGGVNPSVYQAVHHLEFAKSNGQLYVVLWQELSSWNTSTYTDITNAPVNVNVILGNPFSEANQYVPYNGTNSTPMAYDSYAITNISVPDHPVVLQLNGSSSGIVVDDVDAPPNVALTGSWTSYDDIAGFFGTDYLVDSSGHSGDAVTFTPNLPAAGTYEVYANWTADANRSTSVPITVTYNGGTTTVHVNQTANGGVWNDLGAYPFNATGGSIKISDSGVTGAVVADAVRFVPAVIADNSDTNGDVTITGSWTPSTAVPGYYGMNYLTDEDSGQGTKNVQYTPTLPTAGNYEVFARWTADTNRSHHVPITIFSNNGTTTVTVDQTTNGGQWVSLGTYPFYATGGSVTISNTGTTDGCVIADAVEFLQQTSVPEP